MRWMILDDITPVEGGAERFFCTLDCSVELWSSSVGTTVTFSLLLDGDVLILA